MDKNKLQSDFVKLFNDVKEVFFSSEEKTVETKKQEFATEGMLADGSKVVIDGAEPAIGMPVMAVTAEGQAAPIPDGEYTVDFAGKKYNVVCAGGLITEMEAAETPAEQGTDTSGDTQEQPMQSDSATQLPKEITKRMEEIHVFASQKFEAIEAKLEELTKNYEATKAENEKLKSEVAKKNEAFSKLAAEVETLANTPVAETTHTPKERSNGDALLKFKKENGLI